MADNDFAQNANVNVDSPVTVSENGATSGAQYNKNIPGSEGFYVSGNSGGGPMTSAADKMIEMPSDDPGSYMPRAVITEQWLKRQIAIQARIKRMYTGFENPMDAMWFYIAGSVGVDGLGRKQYVVISTGDRQVDIAGKSGGWFSNIGSRIMGNQNNKLNGE